MKQTILIALSLIMFSITSFIVIGIPMTVSGPLDTAQKLLLGMLGLMGYTVSGIYLWFYRINQKAIEDRFERDLTTILKSQKRAEIRSFVDRLKANSVK